MRCIFPCSWRCILSHPAPLPWPASEGGHRHFWSYGKPPGWARFLLSILVWGCIYGARPCGIFLSLTSGPSWSLRDFSPTKARHRSDMSPGWLQSTNLFCLLLRFAFEDQRSLFSSWPRSSMLCGFGRSTGLCRGHGPALNPGKVLWKGCSCRFGIL